MKKSAYFVALALLVTPVAKSDEVQLSSSKLNMQVFTSAATLIAIDKGDFNNWKNKVNRFGSHNGDVSILLEAQQEIARFSTDRSKYEQKGYDFDSSVDSALKSSKARLEDINLELKKLDSELSHVSASVNDYENKQKENDSAVTKEKVGFANSKETFRALFIPSDAKLNKSFTKGLENGSIFEVVKVKEAKTADCGKALYRDAGTSKTKLKKLNEILIGQGKQYDEYLYCPTLEFKWIKSKDRKAYKSGLSSEQLEVASTILKFSLDAENTKLTKVHHDLKDKDVRSQYMKGKRKADELQNRIDKLNNEKRYLSTLSRDDMVRSEKQKLVKLVNKALFALAELTFAEIKKTTSPIPADGHVKYEREEDVYLIVFKQSNFPGYYAKLREGVKNVNVDNAVDIIGLLNLNY